MQAKQPQQLCVYCGGAAQGNYAIHRDGMGEGPEVPLCDAHGGQVLPTCEEIWERIREKVVLLPKIPKKLSK